MLNKLYEWYRIAEVAPSDDVLNKRRLAVGEIVTGLLEGDEELLVSAVAALTSGWDFGFDRSSPLVDLVCEAVKKHQPAFPDDLQENGLHLRACVCVAVGELLSSSIEGEPSDNGKLVAALIISAMGNRAPLKERHLQAALSECLQLAATLAEQVASANRDILEASLSAFPKLELPTEETASIVKFCTDLAEATRKSHLTTRASLQQLRKQNTVLSEELNMLWWLYSDYATASNEARSKLGVESAALQIASELASMSLLPPYESTRHLVRRAVAQGRKPAQLNKKTLSQVVEALGVEEVQAIAAQMPECNSLVTKHPSVMPLSWLCIRITESGSNTGWEAEFARKTGITSTQQLGVADWSVQLFNEIVAKRLLQESIGE